MTEKQIVKYDITEAAISEMESRFMGLAITNIEDKEQFQVVHDARMVVKNHRVAVEKKRKELKADALAWGKKVDTEAKRIFGMLEPIESHLMAEENKVIEAEKRIKEEEDRIEREIIQGRVNSLQMYGAVLPYQEVAVMSDEEFETVLEGSKLAFAAEQKRLADEAAARKAEDERLAAERADLERKKAVDHSLDVQREWYDENILDESLSADEIQGFIDVLVNKVHDGGHSPELRELLGKQYSSAPGVLARKRNDAIRKAELDAIQQKIADDKAALEAEKKAEQDRQDREEFERQAKIQAEQDAKEAAEKAEKDRLAKIEADKAEAERQKALMPDKEKLEAFVANIRDYNVEDWKMQSDEAQALISSAIDEIYAIADDVEEQAGKL